MSHPAKFLVIGIGRGHHKLLGTGVYNRLLYIVGTIGEAGHLHLQRHRVFRLTHIGVDAQARDQLTPEYFRDRFLLRSSNISSVRASMALRTLSGMWSIYTSAVVLMCLSAHDGLRVFDRPVLLQIGAQRPAKYLEGAEISRHAMKSPWRS